ncbi:MAG: type III pantothenate kinase [Mariprofundaceae bacterium]
MNSILAADIGNTQMVFGLSEGADLLYKWRVSSARPITSDELAWQLRGLFVQNQLDPAMVSKVIAASVVPNLDAIFSDACQHVFGLGAAFVGSPQVKTGMAVDYKNPREVGADRICNAVAAEEMFGAPVIVVDCGTATTFDIVSKDSHYAGGLILPGMQVGLEALCDRAAKLPAVPFKRIHTLVGRDTISSIQAGAYWSTVDGLSGIIQRLRSQPGYADATIVATGGYASIIRQEITAIDHLEPDLTLKGLLLLANRN